MKRSLVRGGCGLVWFFDFADAVRPGRLAVALGGRLAGSRCARPERKSPKCTVVGPPHHAHRQAEQAQKCSLAVPTSAARCAVCAPERPTLLYVEIC